MWRVKSTYIRGVRADLIFDVERIFRCEKKGNGKSALEQEIEKIKTHFPWTDVIKNVVFICANCDIVHWNWKQKTFTVFVLKRRCSANNLHGLINMANNLIATSFTFYWRWRQSRRCHQVIKCDPIPNGDGAGVRTHFPIIFRFSHMHRKSKCK